MNSRNPLASGLLGFGPHAGAHRVALRAGISIAVPLLTLYGTGHVDWAIYAAFGAFTSLYGRNSSYGVRLRMQAVTGTIFVLCTVGGVLVALSPARSWLVIPLAALLAAVVAALSDRQNWHPPGSLFPIFAFTACASIPSTPATLGIAAGVSISVVLFSIAVGLAGVLRPGQHIDRTPLPRHPIQLRHVLRGAVGVLVAGLIATGMGIGHPYWAMVSAVVPLAAREFVPQVVRGVQRVLGTCGGLVIAGVLMMWAPPEIVVVLIVIALQFTVEMLIGRNCVLALVFVTPLALLMVHLASPAPVETLLFDRGLETLIGAAVGVLIGYLTRPGTFARRAKSS